MAYGVRTLWSRSCRSSLRTGKPSTRAERPTGEGQQVASGAGREVREMRRAGTILHRIRGQLESRMMRKYPVRFGRGPGEKAATSDLACGLPYPASSSSSGPALV
jgi:hypothetical protein